MIDVTQLVTLLTVAGVGYFAKQCLHLSKIVSTLENDVKYLKKECEEVKNDLSLLDTKVSKIDVMHETIKGLKLSTDRIYEKVMK